MLQMITSQKSFSIMCFDLFLFLLHSMNLHMKGFQSLLSWMLVFVKPYLCPLFHESLSPSRSSWEVVKVSQSFVRKCLVVFFFFFFSCFCFFFFGASTFMLALCFILHFYFHANNGGKMNSDRNTRHNEHMNHRFWGSYIILRTTRFFGLDFMLKL